LISGKASTGAAGSADAVFYFLANNFSFKDSFFSILTLGLIISCFFSATTGFSSLTTSTGARIASSSYFFSTKEAFLPAGTIELRRSSFSSLACALTYDPPTCSISPSSFLTT
jgi:hypothetical protein